MLLPRSTPWLALCVLAGGLSASPKIDLARRTPVAADQTIPVEDFFRHPLWREPRLNPSGTQIAGLVLDDHDNYQLLIHDLDSRQNRGAGALSTEDEITHYVWLGDERVAFFVGTAKRYGLGMYGVDLKHPERAYPLQQYSGAQLITVPRQDRSHPLVWLAHESLSNGHDGGVVVLDTADKGGRFVNFLAATSDGREVVSVRENNDRHIIQRFVGPNDGFVYEYLADRQGRLAFAMTSNRGELAMYRRQTDDTWARCSVDLEHVDVLGAGEKPDEVVALMPREADKPRVLRFLNAATGEPSDVILADKDYDFHGVLHRDPVSDQIVGVSYERDGPRTLWFDEHYRKLQDMLDTQFKGQVVHLIGVSEKSERYLVATYSDRNPPSYHWIDLTKHSGALIANSMPWIDAGRMRPMQMFKFKTRDGRTLDSYVTLPRGASKGHPVPLVVLCHGGPWARDRWGFNPEVQFLASRGYAVLQPNYRGSLGTEWMFPFPDRYEFRKMHDDVTDAVHGLLTTGVVDATRVAIMGTSFGGYLAVSGVAHEPTLYRCAVAIAGVYDWEMVLADHKYDQFEGPAYDRLFHLMGDPATHAAKYNEMSPIHHVAGIRVPVFVAHGKDDPIASVGQSRSLLSELDKHHVAHEQLFIGGEGHGMHHIENQVELYSRVEAFLAKNL